MAKSKSVVKRKGTAAAVPDQFGDLAGRGMENVTGSDLLIPRLAIVQALSPQLDPSQPQYIEGAQIGHMCDVGTGDLFPDEIVFLPCFWRKDYIEWAPRKSGKGLVQIHSSPEILDTCQRDEKNRPFTAEGNLIAETAQWFGLNLSADGRKSFIPMASTQLKHSKRWMTQATSEKQTRKDGSVFTPALFFRTYRLTTGEESNNEGKWSGWRIERGETLPEFSKEWKAYLADAVGFCDSLASGEINANVSHMDGVDREEGAM